MRYRTLTRICILLLACGTLVFTFTYGPSRRQHVTPPRAMLISSDADLDRFWRSTGVKGRIAVFLTRRLDCDEMGNAALGSTSLERALRHGIVRAAYHIVPDRLWPEAINEGLSYHLGSPLKVTDSGFSMLFEEGRVNVSTLSRFWPVHEPVLVVLEPGIWNQEELVRIRRLFRDGELATDLLAILKGSAAEMASFTELLASTGMR